MQKSGYSESIEIWMTTLAVETASDDKTETTYALVCKNGYRGSFDDWIKALTGKTTVDESKTAYELACENGFQDHFQNGLIV